MDTLKPVIIRSSPSGVHFGYLVEQNGNTVKLERSRRIHYWDGANSCSGIAAFGLNVKTSHVAAPVTIVIFEVCEIIDCTLEAVASIESCTHWVKP